MNIVTVGNFENRLTFYWTLNIILATIWVILAFNVVSRADWALENALVFIWAPIVSHYYLRGFLSKTSYFLIFIFTIFHFVGAHYTYSLVPYDQWFTYFFGQPLNAMMNWDRNHYDRLAHFLFGLLFFLPTKEIISRTTSLTGRALWLYTAILILGFSTLYEIIEYGAAFIFGGDLGIAYVGAQGDEWDAQKDQLLAIIGIFVFNLILIIASGIRKLTDLLFSFVYID